MQFSYASPRVVWAILLYILRSKPTVRAAGAAAAGARFLDGILGRNRIRRYGDDRPADWPYGPLQVHDRAGSRHLPPAPQDLANRVRIGLGAVDHPVRRPAGIAGAARLFPGTLACSLSRPFDVSLIALVVMAVWRAKWNIKYETWHLTHILLAVVAVATGLVLGYVRQEPPPNWIGEKAFINAEVFRRNLPPFCRP